MRDKGYSSCLCVYVSVCVSIFSILHSRAFRCPTKGINSYSMENAVKMYNVSVYTSP